MFLKGQKWMILKEKKILFVKERYLEIFQYFKKILGKIFKFLKDTLAKT